MKRIISLLSVFIVLLLFSSCSVNKKDTVAEIETVAVAGVVDDEEITEEELQYFISKTRSTTIMQLASDYGIDDLSSIPSQTFEGKSFDEIVRLNAFKSAVEAKMLFIILKENGIYDDISYSFFRSEMQKYNASHSADDNAAGLSSIDEEDFYSYYISLGEIELGKISDKPEEMIAERINSAKTGYYGENNETD